MGRLKLIYYRNGKRKEVIKMIPSATKKFNGKKYQLWESRFLRKGNASNKAARLQKLGIPTKIVAYKDRQGQTRYAIYAC